MIGGIFNVLGRAAQQSAEQKQKNTDAQNEMNRMMMMAGYRPNEADPTLTQGGAGLLDSLKSGLKGSFGSTPYEFSPSQYSFDPESPQGQMLALRKQEVGDLKDWRDEQSRLEQERLDQSRERDRWEKFQNDRSHSWERYQWNRERSDKNKERWYRNQRNKVEDDFKQQGLDIAKTQATNSGYRILTKNGSMITVDFNETGEDGRPKTTFHTLPVNAPQKTRDALQLVLTLSQLTSDDELMDKLGNSSDNIEKMLDGAIKAFMVTMVESARKDRGSGTSMYDEHEPNDGGSTSPTQEPYINSNAEDVDPITWIGGEKHGLTKEETAEYLEIKNVLKNAPTGGRSRTQEAGKEADRLRELESLIENRTTRWEGSGRTGKRVDIPMNEFLDIISKGEGNN